jgi:hypothetical protein
MSRHMRIKIDDLFYLFRGRINKGNRGKIFSKE